MPTTSEEYLIKLLIGDSDFSFVIETTVFQILCVNLEDRLKGLFNVAKTLLSLRHILRRLKTVFPALIFGWVVITTLYHLMLQSWYQKTAQSLVNTLSSFSWHNRLP